MAEKCIGGAVEWANGIVFIFWPVLNKKSRSNKLILKIFAFKFFDT